MHDGMQIDESEPESRNAPGSMRRNLQPDSNITLGIASQPAKQPKSSVSAMFGTVIDRRFRKSDLADMDVQSSRKSPQTWYRQFSVGGMKTDESETQS
jgi:hypothetical protein